MLALAMLAPAPAAASVPRTAAPRGDLDAASPLSLPQTLTPEEPGLGSQSGLFAGDELARALDQRTNAERFALGLGAEALDVAGLPHASRGHELSFHPLQDLALIDSEPPCGLAFGDPETRIGGSGIFLGSRIGERERLRLGAHWGYGLWGGEHAADQPQDPLGLSASVSRSGVIIGIRPDGTRYRIEPGTDPVVALRILESDADITTASEQVDILQRARMAIPRSSAQRPGEAAVESRDPNYRRFTHYPSGGSWVEAALIATTGLPPQTREQEIASSVAGMVAAAAPAVAGPIARAKGGVGRPIQPAVLPEELPWGERPPLRERLTYLYEKVGPNGEHLKYGISQDPATRYGDDDLAGGRLRIIASGTREEMLKVERELHSTLPIGPEELQKQYIQIQKRKGLKPPPYGDNAPE